MIAKFTFGYNFTPSDEVEEALNAILDKPLERQADDKANPKPASERPAQSYVTYEAELEKVLAILDKKGSIEVTGMGDPRPMLDLRDQLLERFADIEQRLLRAATPSEGYVNPRVDVHVPGLGLLLLDEVMLHADGCTDELQTYLNEGWRIVAACPQPDQRRPDYILGRAGKKED